jgi:peptide-methionine (S)-S-oxide reductase
VHFKGAQLHLLIQVRNVRVANKPILSRLPVFVFALFAYGGDVMPADKGAFPDPAVDVKPASGKQTAVLAGGCFWCIEAVFEVMEGVDDVISGYSGGAKETAKYDIVSTGRTGHAEAVLITYDPAKTSFGQLLKIFFSVAHDPTTLNRQGPDTGPQYRSAVFHVNEEQKRVAEAYVRQINDAHVLRNPIVTRIVPLDKFYTAEAYHQNYAVQNRSNPYIVAVSDPKVEKLKKMYPGCVRKRK